MARLKKVSAEAVQATWHYLSSVKRSMARIDSATFDHYNLQLRDGRLVKFLLAKSFTEKKFVPDLAAEIMRKGLAADKSFQDYINNDLEISLSTITSMNLRTRKRMTDKKERDTGHSHFTAT